MYRASQLQTPKGIRHLIAGHIAPSGTKSFCARETNTDVPLTRGTGSRQGQKGPSSGASPRRSPTRRISFSILRSPERHSYVTENKTD